MVLVKQSTVVLLVSQISYRSLAVLLESYNLNRLEKQIHKIRYEEKKIVYSVCEKKILRSIISNLK